MNSPFSTGFSGAAVWDAFDQLRSQFEPKPASRVGRGDVRAAVLALLVAFGGYSVFTTQFVSYLAAPMQAARFSHGDFAPSGAPALDGSADERPTDISELPEFAADGSAQPPQGDGNGSFGEYP